MARLRARRVGAAFAWSVREVSLQPHAVLPHQPHPEFVTPPQYAACGGWGTSSRSGPWSSWRCRCSRSDQKGTYHRISYFQERRGRQGDTLGLRCAASLGDDRLFLFDPRIGLPVPGPRTGLAAWPLLQEAVHDASVLAQLTVDKRYPYDMTAERAAKVVVRQFCPLSAPAAAGRIGGGATPEREPRAGASGPGPAGREGATDQGQVRPGVGATRRRGFYAVDAGAKNVSGAGVLRQFLPDTGRRYLPTGAMRSGGSATPCARLSIARAFSISNCCHRKDCRPPSMTPWQKFPGAKVGPGAACIYE